MGVRATAKSDHYVHMMHRQGTLLGEGWKQVRAEQESVSFTCEMLHE